MCIIISRFSGFSHLNADLKLLSKGASGPIQRVENIRIQQVNIEALESVFIYIKIPQYLRVFRTKYPHIRYAELEKAVARFSMMMMRSRHLNRATLGCLQ